MPCEKHTSYVLLAQLPGDMVSGHGVSDAQKTTSVKPQRVSSHQLPDHLSQTPGVHLVTETASHLLEDSADSFHTAQTER